MACALMSKEHFLPIQPHYINIPITQLHRTTEKLHHSLFTVMTDYR